jgi:hypothetical protein
LVELDFSGAQAFDFPAFQSDAGFEAFFNAKFVKCFTIRGDSLICFLFLRHSAEYNTLVFKNSIEQ